MTDFLEYVTALLKSIPISVTSIRLTPIRITISHIIIIKTEIESAVHLGNFGTQIDELCAID